MRMVDCEYCELQFKAMELYQHKDHCGSRTDVCEKCQQYVMLKEMKSHLENMCATVVQPDGRGSHPANPGEVNYIGGGAVGYGGGTTSDGTTAFGGTAGYGGEAIEPDLDQSWVNAIAACNEDGHSLSSILAENLAGSERQWPNNPSFVSDNTLAHELQQKEEKSYTSSAEDQQKQFELLRQMQSDAEMAQRLQEQYNTENEPPVNNPDTVVPNDEPYLPPHHMPPEVHNMPNRTIPHDTGDMIPNGGAHMIPAGVQDEGTEFELPDDIAALHIDQPQNLMPEEDLIPCEWCGKGIPPQYLQSHQLQTCPQLPNNDKFQPEESVDGPVQATDDHDITPTVEGTYNIIKCEHCNARVPAEHYTKHLELCDAATGPCEHCNKSVPIAQLFEHEVTCRYNKKLFRPGMTFPHNQWPSGKGKDNQRKPHYPPSKDVATTLPVAMPTNHHSSSWNSNSSHSNSSYHSNSDSHSSSFESRYPAVAPADEEDMFDDMNTPLPPQRHDISQLTRPPIHHHYSPAGAGGVSVKGTGIKVTQPPEQY
ncbi:TRAF-type zinc finger domain-containing protein 1-like isoform X2 [Dysidea avara]